jgi:hypothetical protein
LNKSTYWAVERLDLYNASVLCDRFKKRYFIVFVRLGYRTWSSKATFYFFYIFNYCVVAGSLVLGDWHSF